MNIKWPPEETMKYEAKNPTIENGIAISALPGGNPKKKKDRSDEGR